MQIAKVKVEAERDDGASRGTGAYSEAAREYSAAEKGHGDLQIVSCS